MSGLEVAGLVLGVFPVLTQMVSSYRGELVGRDAAYLLESLRNNELVFRNGIELMLRSIIPATELEVLLEDLGGDAWKDDALNDRIMTQMGRDARAIIRNLKDIYRTLSRLKQTLPTRYANSDPHTFAGRSKQVIKSFVHGASDKASLDRLQQRIAEFRRLTQDYVDLALPRSQLSDALLQELDLVRNCAYGLHDALRGGWNCNCDKDKLHPVNIELDIWSKTAQNKGRTDRLEFSLLCADAPNNPNVHWMTAETAVSSPPSSLSQASGSSAHDKINDLCAVLKVPDIIKRPAPSRRRLGSISDSDLREYDIYKDNRTKPTSTVACGTLSQFFDRHSSLTNKTRVRLALKLAWAVLQISSTGWLKGEWTKENVLLVLATSDDPMAYITHGFESSKHKSVSSTLEPTSLSQIANGDTCASLWALGVLMVELCCDKPIEKMAADNEKAHVTLQSFLTATRLARGSKVDSTLGAGYAEAMRACLQPPFPVDLDAEGRPRDYIIFAKDVYQKIIVPLKTAAAHYGP